MSSPKTVEIADFNKQRKRSMGRDALEAAELPNILFIPFLMSQFLNPGIIYSNLVRFPCRAHFQIRESQAT